MSMKNKETMNPPIEENKETTTLATYSDDFIKEVAAHVKKVSSELKKTEKAFMAVACEMAWLYENERFLALGDKKTFEQFALERFGFKKTQAYGLVDLVNRFGTRSDEGIFTIDDEYSAYGQTKLIYMKPLTDKQILENITPTMSSRDIKKKVKELISNNSLGISDKATTRKRGAGSKIIDVDVTMHNSQNLVVYSNFKDFEDDAENFFHLVANAFETKSDCKVLISYEWQS